MESDVYGFAMILWYMAARETEPFRPKVKEQAYGTIIEGPAQWQQKLTVESEPAAGKHALT